VANNKDFIVNNLVEVGGSMKATVGSSSSTGDVSIGFYSVESGSYDNVTFEIEGSVPLAMAFGDNGTKMYISTNGQDRVFQYSLSTAYDISTASYASVQDNFLVTNATQGIAFSPDGTKMYTCDTQSDIVIQYSLSTAWSVKTASVDTNFSPSSQDSFPTGITLNTDGTKMYIVGTANRTLYQYSLSTAYNVSTASYNNVSFYFGNEQDQGKTVRFNDDGTKMFLGGWYAPGAATPYGKIHQYSLSTAYDISTASYDSIIFDVGTEVGYSYQLDDFVFNDDGSKLVAINSAPTSPTILTYFVTQYSTEKIVPSITLDTSTGNYFTHTLSSDVGFLFSNLSDVQTFQVEVTNSSSSEYKVYWPSSVRFSNGLLLPSPGPSEKYIYTVVANDFGGTNYFVTVNTGP
jgi:hypothetical protein